MHVDDVSKNGKLGDNNILQKRTYFIFGARETGRHVEDVHIVSYIILQYTI